MVICKLSIRGGKLMYLNKETISDILCDLYDIRNMAILEGFGNLPKDNEGTETTIFDCLENCIEIMEAN